MARPASAIALVTFPGAATLTKCDDCSSSANLGFSAQIGSTSYSNVFVNSNGNLSFRQGIQSYTPFTFPSSPGVFGPIIAPFFADVNATSSGSITYGTGTYNGRAAFAATYLNVPGYLGTTPSAATPASCAGSSSRGAECLFDSFQVILTDRSDIAAGDIDIYFNYASIEWDQSAAAGNSIGGAAIIDMGNGTGYQVPGSNTPALLNAPNHGYTVPGSPGVDNATSLIFASNDGVAGQLVFQLRGGVLLTPAGISFVPPPSVPEPATWAMFIAGFGLIGTAMRRRPTASRAAT